MKRLCMSCKNHEFLCRGGGGGSSTSTDVTQEDITISVEEGPEGSEPSGGEQLGG